MKTYLLYREQSDGCDYTIGCGRSLTSIKASSMEEALEKIAGLDPDWKSEISESESREDYIFSIINDSYLANADLDNEQSCIEMTLYEVSNEKNILPILRKKIDELKEFKIVLDKKSQDRQELKEFERLKKKFEK